MAALNPSLALVFRQTCPIPAARLARFFLSNLPDRIRFEWNRRAFKYAGYINDNNWGGKT
jgi:hypothetical protein